MAAASWDTIGIYPLITDYLTIGAGDRASLAAPAIGSYNATQATDGARPTYSATALNGGPGLAFDGGDSLVTGAIDLTGVTAVVLVAVLDYSDAAASVLQLQEDASNEITITTTAQVNGRITGRYREGGTIHGTVQTSGTPSAGPIVLTLTLDVALTSSILKLRVDGADSTDVVNVDLDPSGAMISNPLLNLGVTSFGDAMSYLAIFTGSSAVPLTEVGQVETELIASLASGDYLT
jgi:hypothetical protein